MAKASRRHRPKPCLYRLLRIALPLSIAAGALVLASQATAAEERPAKANWLFFRGSAYFSQRHMDETIDDFTAAIELSPDDIFPYCARAAAYEAQGDYPAACTDYSTALELDSGKEFLYVDRGRIKKKMGRYREALADYDAAIAKNPILARAYYAKAILLASCPDDAIRDGVAAVQCASRGCDLTNRTRPHLNALAAAYGEFGDWASAVATQTEALRLAKDPEDRKVCEERLRLYQAKQPYRETPDVIERDRTAFLRRPQRVKLLQIEK